MLEFGNGALAVGPVHVEHEATVDTLQEWFAAPAGRQAAPPPHSPSRTRFQKKGKFFGWFFGPARVRMAYVNMLRRGVFCNVAKVHACVVAMILTRAPHDARIWTTMHEKSKKM